MQNPSLEALEEGSLGTDSFEWVHSARCVSFDDSHPPPLLRRAPKLSMKQLYPPDYMAWPAHLGSQTLPDHLTDNKIPSMCYPYHQNPPAKGTSKTT